MRKCNGVKGDAKGTLDLSLGRRRTEQERNPGERKVRKGSDRGPGSWLSCGVATPEAQDSTTLTNES